MRHKLSVAGLAYVKVMSRVTYAFSSCDIILMISIMRCIKYDVIEGLGLKSTGASMRTHAHGPARTQLLAGPYLCRAKH